MSMQHWWDGADRGNRSTGRKTCFSAIVTTTNPTRARLGTNVGPPDVRPATN